MTSLKQHPVKGHNIVVVGGGVGGLSAGIVLGLLGYSVTIVEKNPEAGGLMRSYLRAGFDCPVGVHYVGALGDAEPLGRMFSLLGISGEDLFYRMGSDGIIDRYVFDDFVFDLPVGLDAFADNLRRACPADRVAIDVIMKNLRQTAGKMLEASFLLNSGDPFQNMDLLRPMGEYLDEIQASGRLRAILAVPCQLIGVVLEDCPVIFHHMLLAGYLLSSWRLKEGGARMADVFAERFTALGGKLILNCAAEKIRVEGGKVSGVRLETGADLPADGVVAAIHPKVLLGLLDEDVLRPSLRERIAALQETEGVIVLHAGVDAASHPALDHNIYRLHCDDQGAMKDGVFYQMRAGGPSGRNLLTIITRSLYSDWHSWENTRTGKRGALYKEKKMAMAFELLKKAETLLGPLTQAKILDVFTPLTLRDYVNCPEGSCYGALRSTGQLLKLASLNNLPVGGLCLAGQNAVAPGVMGSILGSFGAVRKLIGPKRFEQEFFRQL